MTDRSIPAGDRPGLSRRGFLGGVGASAAALTVGGVLGDAQPASAAYYMKWGAVVSPGDASNNIDFSRKVDILRRMRPQTARISMFWGDPYNRRFSDSQLDALRGTGLTEMIIQSSEDPDPNLARHQLSLLLPYIDAHPNTLFVWELGNEPDWHQPTNPWLARWNRLATIRDNKPSQDRGNLLWAVNMPAGRWSGDGTGFTGSSGGYFDSFVRDTGDGLGGMLSGPYQPDVVTVHCYSSTYLTRGADGGGERNPYKMIDYVRGWNNRISMKVTEAGIDGAKSDRGYRYVSFGSSVANETAGQIDSVCFYGIPPAERQYGIGEGEADQIGTHP